MTGNSAAPRRTSVRSLTPRWGSLSVCLGVVWRRASAMFAQPFPGAGEGVGGGGIATSQDAVYQRLFRQFATPGGFVDASTAVKVLSTSGLSREVLGTIWATVTAAPGPGLQPLSVLYWPQFRISLQFIAAVQSGRPMGPQLSAQLASQATTGFAQLLPLALLADLTGAAHGASSAAAPINTPPAAAAAAAAFPAPPGSGTGTGVAGAGPIAAVPAGMVTPAAPQVPLGGGSRPLHAPAPAPAAPVPSSSPATPPVQPAAKELQLELGFSAPPLAQAIASAAFVHLGGHGSDGRVGGAAVVDFFLRSGVPKTRLREMWQLCVLDCPATQDKATLRFPQFCAALRLIAHAQARLPADSLAALRAPEHCSLPLCPAFPGVPFVEQLLLLAKAQETAQAQSPLPLAQVQAQAEAHRRREQAQVHMSPQQAHSAPSPISLASFPLGPSPSATSWSAVFPSVFETDAAPAPPTLTAKPLSAQSAAAPAVPSAGRKYVDASLFSLAPPPTSAGPAAAAAAAAAATTGDGAHETNWAAFGGLATPAPLSAGAGAGGVGGLSAYIHGTAVGQMAFEAAGAAVYATRSATITSAFDDIDALDDPHVLPVPDPQLQQLSDALGAHFDALDTKARAFLTGAQVVAFFTRTGVQREVLRRIWLLADSGQKNFLSKSDFIVAARLVALAQTGYAVPWSSEDAVLLALLDNSAPFPLAVGPPDIDSTTSPSPSTDDVGVDDGQGRGDTTSALLPLQLGEFELQYLRKAWNAALGHGGSSAGEASHLLSGKQAVTYFLSAGFDRGPMREVWEFAVAPKAAGVIGMDFGDFCKAVRCVAAVREGRPLSSFALHPLALPMLSGVPPPPAPPPKPQPQRQPQLLASFPPEAPATSSHTTAAGFLSPPRVHDPQFYLEEASRASEAPLANTTSGHDHNHDDDADFSAFSSGGIIASTSGLDLVTQPAAAYDRALPLENLMSQYFQSAPMRAPLRGATVDVLDAAAVAGDEDWGGFGTEELSAAPDLRAGVGAAAIGVIVSGVRTPAGTAQDSDEWGELEETSDPGPTAVASVVAPRGLAASNPDEWADFDDGDDVSAFDGTNAGAKHAEAPASRPHGAGLNATDAGLRVRGATPPSSGDSSSGSRLDPQYQPTTGPGAVSDTLTAAEEDPFSPTPSFEMLPVEHAVALEPPPLFEQQCEQQETRPPWPAPGASAQEFVRALLSRERFEEAALLIENERVSTAIEEVKAAIAAAAVDEDFEQAIALRKTRDSLLSQCVSEDVKRAWFVEGAPTSTVADMCRDLDSSGQFPDAVRAFKSAFRADPAGVNTADDARRLQRLRREAALSFELLEVLMTTRQLHAAYFESIEASVIEELDAFERVVADMETGSAADNLDEFFSAPEVTQFAASLESALVCLGRVSTAKAQSLLGGDELQRLASCRHSTRVAAWVSLLVQSALERLESERSHDVEHLCEICLLKQGTKAQVANGKVCHQECGAWWLNRVQGALPSS